MTIITQPVSEKKLAKQKEPLFDSEKGFVGFNQPNAQHGETESEPGSPLVVTVMRTSNSRVHSMTTFCVFLTALLVLSTGVIGGVYLYRQFNQYHLRHFRGWCSVPYREPERLYGDSLDDIQTILSDHSEIQKSIQMANEMDKMKTLKQALSMLQSDGSIKSENPANVRPPFDNFFDEEFDIDIEFEQYERIEVPDFSRGRRGRFIHDFSMNKTGIMDIDGQRCFVMDLNRTLVLPPKSLYDMINKMRSGYYDIDTEIIHENYRVITPAIYDFNDVGYFIGRECAKLPTYKLEKVYSPVFKRELSHSMKTVFTEFAGSKINEISIVNLHNAPGAK